MPSRTTGLSNILVALAAVCAGAVSACSTMSVPTLKVRGIDSYDLRQDQRALVIAVHPMTTQQEVQETFNIDLLDKGILPILLLAENRSASTSFILDRARIGIGAGDSGLSPSQRQQIGTSEAGEALVMSGSVLLSFPLIFAGSKMSSDASVVAHGIADKEFYSRTLDPGQRTHGVMYLRLAGGSARQGPYVLKLSPIDVDSSETMTFTFSITVMP